MADSTARTLALLSLLQTHRHWTGPQLADRLGVSERTVRRDVDRLRELGYPVDASPGIAGGYQLGAGAHLPPLLFDDDEAVALAVGLRSAAGASIDGIEESALGVMTKLEQILPDRLRRRVDAVHSGVSVLRWAPSTPSVPASSLATLTQACRDREEVRFEYRRRDGEESSRLVRPHQLVSAGRRWYLAAWDVRRDDWRTFRVDRMETPRPAGARFEPLAVPGGDTAAFVAESLAAQPGSHRAQVVVRGDRSEIEGVARWLGATVEHVDGRTRLALTADALPWLATMIAMVATHVDVEIEDAPAEVWERVASACDRLAGASRRR